MVARNVILHKDKSGLEALNKDRKISKNKVYIHFKGGLYIVEDVATNSETGEQMVIYRHLGTGELFVRPKDMFMDIKQTEQGFTFRFSKYLI